MSAGSRRWLLEAWMTGERKDPGPFHRSRVEGDANLDAALKGIESRFKAPGDHRRWAWSATPV